MESFDLNYYLRNEKNGIIDTILNDGTEVILRSLDNYYVKEVRIKKNSPYSTTFLFYQSSLKLKEERKTFFDCKIGVTRMFDEHGNIISERNYDVQYKFTIDDVVKKMKNEFGVDLTNRNQKIDVTRGSNPKIKYPAYVLKVYSDERSYRYLVIDGQTGEIKKNALSYNIE